MIDKPFLNKETESTNKEMVLSKQEMLDYGYQIVDTIVEHFENQHLKAPVSVSTREEMDSVFLEEAPENPMNAIKVLEFVKEKVFSETTNVAHPKFFSFVPSPSNFISAMSDSLATGFNIFSGGWSTSAAAELEIVCINWLLKLFNFPVKKGGGIFTSGGSMANLTALVTARREKLGENFENGTIYMSDQTHSSNIKAIRIIGLKKEQVRIIPTDLEFKMSLNKLRNAIAKDKLMGFKPFCIIANAGTTNTGSVDNLFEISKICKAERIWLHIDAAYGGGAILSTKGALALKGIEKANSITIDPHKWFYQPYEIGCLLVRNHKWLSNTFTEKPEYLKDIEGNQSEINFYDYGIQLTRRFRALKFYMSIKTFGLKAFREAVTYNIELAEKTEALIRKSKHWEIVAPANLAIINFRYNPVDTDYKENELDRINQAISQRISNQKSAMLVTTILQNQIVLRMCLINPRTTINSIKETLKLCHDFAIEISKTSEKR
ncbi:pyridoxal phosphate-dependent decarboxylase family protein [Hyunsoonleella pacifica]|uniref:Aminotransferase class I/II-fold pyridoxal phosphate-dependent enzyme n=1 Tax=Hyunsoonleella pacifica TaxID=1080224 RepID=A0A4V2JAZ9_9FLAO|nr:aspartate aminotransferase family protein [Hyunsoonleella pacifica]TBN16293.1 aminotransferase class I/II-fold pyridoxal phosphate-dependent enzyme [Hyunsoonleella pacifica]GGD20679.1 L-2,4-diaminobutyrate decarboxylase [Hyunsoonleella pacifica]